MKKKLITCLDVRNGQLTKGVKFENNQDLGDPIEAAKKYNADGIDEVVVYDFSASTEGRNTQLDTVEGVAKVINVPLTVGGGIKNLEDCRRLINAGAHKLSINTAAVRSPSLLQEAAKEFGRKAVVISCCDCNCPS